MKVLVKVKKIKKMSDMFFVSKSNNYGIGNGIFKYINNMVDGYIFTDYYNYYKNKKYIKKNKKILILYEDIIVLIKNNYFENPYHFAVVSNDIELQKIFYYYNRILSQIYIRLDIFIGLHGFDNIKILFERINKYNVKGILIHFNENIQEFMWEIVFILIRICLSKNIYLNIGGGNFTEYFPLLKNQKLNLQYRSCKYILLNKNFFEINICFRVLNKKWCNDHNIIGYDSYKKDISGTYLYLINVGYGDFGILREIFYKKFNFS